MNYGANLESIVKKSIAETVADSIRDAILAGKFQPGEKLKEQELCKELNVSRTPLREAYRILQTQNLINYSPYVGVTVAELTPRFVEELWYIKALLAPQCVALAAENATPSQIDALYAILEEQKGLWEKSPELFHSLDNKLHLAIAACAGNTELHKLLATLYEGTGLARSLTLLNRDSIKHSCSEHRLIVDAVANKDKESGMRHMLEHLERSKRAILARIA